MGAYVQVGGGSIQGAYPMESNGWGKTFELRIGVPNL